MEVEWISIKDRIPFIKSDTILFIWDNGNKIGYGTFTMENDGEFLFWDEVTQANVSGNYWCEIPPMPE